MSGFSSHHRVHMYHTVYPLFSFFLPLSPSFSLYASHLRHCTYSQYTKYRNLGFFSFLESFLFCFPSENPNLCYPTLMASLFLCHKIWASARLVWHIIEHWCLEGLLALGFQKVEMAFHGLGLGIACAFGLCLGNMGWDEGLLKQRLCDGGGVFCRFFIVSTSRKVRGLSIPQYIFFGKRRGGVGFVFRV